MSTKFSERLTSLILKSGMKQAEIAEKSGITAPYLSSLKKGIRENPSSDVVVALAKTLNVPIHNLVGDENLPSDNMLREEPAIYGRELDPQARSTLHAAANDFETRIRRHQVDIATVSHLLETAVGNPAQAANFFRLARQEIDTLEKAVQPQPS